MMLRKIALISLLLVLTLPVLAEENSLAATLPSFSLPSVSGQTLKLNDYLKSDAVLLCFFASWSKSCQQELAFLQQLQDKHAKKGLKVIGVSFDRKPDELKSYLTDNKIDLTIAYDKKMKTLKDFKVLIIPTLLMINKEGEIINTYVDFDENVEKSVTKDLNKLLVP